MASTERQKDVEVDARAPEHDNDSSSSDVDDLTSKREIGHQAVWTLSSCKLDHGVQQLRDNSFDSYWQSDGTMPHHVILQFPVRTMLEWWVLTALLLQQLSIYIDYTKDESYTPREISIKAGTHPADLETLSVVELEEPVGWVHLPLRVDEVTVLSTHCIQLIVHANHQSGKDVHIRQIKVFGPSSRIYSIGHEMSELYPFTSPEFKVWDAVR